SRDGAHRVTLRRLPPAEAVALLAAAVGPDRAAAEPRAVAELAELCARLPLALRVAGEHAGRHPDRPPAAPVADPRQPHDLLRAYAVRVAAEDEPAAGRDAAVRRMLDWYAHTVAGAARLEWRSSRRLPPPEPPPADPSVTPLDLTDPEGGDEAGTSWLD